MKDKPKVEKPSKSKIMEAQSQVQHIANVSEVNPDVMVAIEEAIEETERRLLHLHALQKSYLTTSLEVVESARRDLEALLAD